jgi:hypothetical protein
VALVTRRETLLRFGCLREELDRCNREAADDRPLRRGAGDGRDPAYLAEAKALIKLE